MGDPIYSITFNIISNIGKIQASSDKMHYVNFLDKCMI